MCVLCIWYCTHSPTISRFDIDSISKRNTYVEKSGPKALIEARRMGSLAASPQSHTHPLPQARMG